MTNATTDGITAVELRRPGAVTAEDVMPLLDLATAVRRRNFMVEVTRNLMVAGVDYGVIPGTGSKPTLLKPGAERLCTLFGLSPEVQELAAIEDWDGTGKGHGESLFYYRYRVRLTRNGILLGEGIGSCSSRETKFRYRAAERKCPKCDKPAIIKGRDEYGGGWLCFPKRGGCGAKFKNGDGAIEGQSAGRVINPEVADAVNTIQKMAHKRALVAAVLIAVNASEFYTQDMEDLEVIDVPSALSVRQAPGEPEPRREAKSGAGSTADAAVLPELEALWTRMNNRTTIGETLRGLLDDLVARTGDEAARSEFERLLAHYGAARWEDLKTVKIARKFAGDLYALIQQTPGPDLDPELYEQEGESRHAV